MTVMLDQLQQHTDRIVNTQTGEIVARYPAPEKPLTNLSGGAAALNYPVLVYPNPGGFMGVAGHDMLNDAMVLATQTALTGEDVKIFRGLLLKTLDYKEGDEQPRLATIPEVPAVKPADLPEDATEEQKAEHEEAMKVYQEAVQQLDAESATLASNRYTQFVDYLADFNASLMFRVVNGKLYLAGGVKRPTGEVIDPAGIKVIAQQYDLELMKLKGFQSFTTREAFEIWLDGQTLTGTGLTIKDAQGGTWLV